MTTTQQIYDSKNPELLALKKKLQEKFVAESAALEKKEIEMLGTSTQKLNVIVDQQPKTEKKISSVDANVAETPLIATKDIKEKPVMERTAITPEVLNFMVDYLHKKYRRLLSAGKTAQMRFLVAGINEKNMSWTFSRLSSEYEVNETYEELLKAYEDDQIKRQLTQEDLSILKDPELFNLCDAELNKAIVGENSTRKTILLVALGGMIVENSSPTSYNLCVNDESGVGKDYIVSKVLDLLPKGIIERRKRISEKVFTYWHNEKFEPDWTWHGKILYLEDVSDAIYNSDVFKVMSSSDGCNVATILINQTPTDIKVKGKPVVIVTIAEASPKSEMLRRYPMLNLDSSEEQTRKIIQQKAKHHANGCAPQYDPVVVNALSRLQRVKVVVPFSEAMGQAVGNYLIMRTNFDRFVDYVAFSAGIHQHSRERDNKGFVIATGEDYTIAREAMLAITSNATNTPLTKTQKKLLQVFSKLGDGQYSVPELEADVTFLNRKSIYTETRKLADIGLLRAECVKEEGIPRPYTAYSLKKSKAFTLPSWSELEKVKLEKVNVVNVVNSMSAECNLCKRCNMEIIAPDREERLNRICYLCKDH